MRFEVGDILFHPLHGAGTVDHLESRRIEGKTMEFYAVKLPNNPMAVMIPVEGCEKIGVRPLVSSKEIDDVLSNIPALVIDNNENWNKRYRENMVRIKSGDLRELISVIKALVLRDDLRGLSTGERKMLVSSKQIFLTEMAYVKGCSFEEAEKILYAHIRA